MKGIIGWIGLLLALPVFADSPLATSQSLTACSASQGWCADSDPRSDSTRVSSAALPGASWIIPGRHRWMFVSEAGSVVVGYDGMNLIPVSVTLVEPVLWFYRRGGLVRTVTLGDL